MCRALRSKELNFVVMSMTFIKMTHKEQNKILDNKIQANNAQYDLDKMNAEISVYSRGNLSKYEYLTKKDLGYKPDAFEHAKFEYSPFGKIFTDGLTDSVTKWLWNYDVLVRVALSEKLDSAIKF